MIEQAGIAAALDRAFPLDDSAFPPPFTDSEEEPMPKRFHIEIYQKRFVGMGRLQWQFRAESEYGERLARGESYNNRGDMMETIEELFGSDVAVFDVTGGRMIAVPFP